MRIKVCKLIEIIREVSFRYVINNVAYSRSAIDAMKARKVTTTKDWLVGQHGLGLPRSAIAVAVHHYFMVALCCPPPPPAIRLL